MLMNENIKTTTKRDGMFSHIWITHNAWNKFWVAWTDIADNVNMKKGFKPHTECQLNIKQYD